MLRIQIRMDPELVLGFGITIPDKKRKGQINKTEFWTFCTVEL